MMLINIVISHPTIASAIHLSKNTIFKARTKPELKDHTIFIDSNGDDGIRTHDLWLAKPALSQLSYVPEPCAIARCKLPSASPRNRHS